MKHLNTIYSIMIVTGMGMLMACSKSFIELEPRGTALEDNFYRNQDEVYQGLIAVYDVMQWGTSGGYTMKMPLLSAASDECHAGGSDASDQPNWVMFDNFTMNANFGPQDGLWQKNFSGVYRANLLLSKVEKSDQLDAAFRSRVVAEAKFLRAYFYFDLIRFFGHIPLITGVLPTSELYTQEQTDPDAVYQQVEQDLRDAMEDLPMTVPSSEQGRVTQGTAIALLGKVILFQNEDARMGEVADLLRQINQEGNPYGYTLLEHYGDVFDYSKPFSSESILEIPHSNLAAWGDWDWVNGGEGNVAPQFVGPADFNGPLLSAGWGFCPITEALVEVMEGDPRFAYTIIDGKALQAEGASYSPRYQNTDYFIRKYAPLSAYRSALGTAELNWPINEIEIRLADTYLMEAEALVRSHGDQARAKALLDAVRGRVGLGSVSPTLDNIYRERRLELATEGHRFFDLVRTGRAAEVLGPMGFMAGKHEILPIPQDEIDVTNGVLVQNPNY